MNFYLQVDWICHLAYGDPVVVEMHVEGHDVKELRRFNDILEAAIWAKKWLEDRGFTVWCDIDKHQRLDHSHLDLYPCVPGPAAL